MWCGFVYIDPLYLALVAITLLISIAAQAFISSTYKKWSQVRNSANLTGEQVGYTIVNRTGLGGGRGAAPADTPELRRLRDLRAQGIITDQEYEAKRTQIQRSAGDTSVNTSSIRFAQVSGQLTDNFDPRSNVVNLSEGVASRPSVAAMAIVAHELGHAQQHEQGSPLMALRNVLVPAVVMSPRISYLLIFLGLLFRITALFWLGVIVFGIMVVFSLITIPVEADASRRGLKLLDQAGLMQADTDRRGSRQVLTAAASTYVAAAVTSILQLLYYISIARRQRR